MTTPLCLEEPNLWFPITVNIQDSSLGSSCRLNPTSSYQTSSLSLRTPSNQVDLQSTNAFLSQNEHYEALMQVTVFGEEFVRWLNSRPPERLDA
jgi:hypothetical protein